MINIIKLNRCNLPRQCVSHPNFFKINRRNPLVLKALCLDGCDFSDRVDIEYRIYYNIGDEITQIWQEDNTRILPFANGIYF